MLLEKVLLQIDHTPMGNGFKVLDRPVSETGGVTFTHENKFLAPVRIVMPVDAATARRLKNDAIDDGFGFSEARVAQKLETLYAEGVNLLQTKPRDFSLPEKFVGTLISLVISRP